MYYVLRGIIFLASLISLNLISWFSRSVVLNADFSLLGILLVVRRLITIGSISFGMVAKQQRTQFLYVWR